MFPSYFFSSVVHHAYRIYVLPYLLLNDGPRQRLICLYYVDFFIGAVKNQLHLIIIKANATTGTIMHALHLH